MHVVLHRAGRRRVRAIVALAGAFAAMLLGACQASPAVGVVSVAAPSELEPALGLEPTAPLALAAPAPADQPSGIAGDLIAKCRALRAPPAQSCDAFEDTKIDCEIYVGVLAEPSAIRAVECLTRRSGRITICKPSALEECFLAAVRTTGPDSAARDSCTALVQGCTATRSRVRDLSLNSCMRAVATVRGEHQAALISCMSQGCNVAACIWDLVER
jgi:hypothetical protein